MLVKVVLADSAQMVSQAVGAMELSFSRTRMQASEDVLRAIDVAKNVLKDSLDYAVDKVDDKIQERLAEIKEMATRVVADLSQSALMLSNTSPSFPWTGADSQVSFISPRSVVIPSAFPSVLIEIKGNFPKLNLDHVSLTFSGQKATLMGNTTFLLNFSIATELLFPPELKGPVAVGALRLRSSTSTGYFKIPIGKIPPIAGRVSIVHSKEAPKRGEPQYRSSQEYEQNSSKAEKDITSDYTITATVGWKILSFQLHHNPVYLAGNPTYKIKHQSENSVTYEVTTKRKGDHGITKKIRFTIGFTEYPEVQNVEYKPEPPFDLEWGQSRTLDFPLKHSTITFDPFDGSPQRTFISSTSDDPFIKIAPQGDKFVVAARDPRDVLFKSILQAYMPTADELKEPDLYSKTTVILGAAAGSAVGFFAGRFFPQARL